MNNLIKFIKDNAKDPKLSVNIVPTGDKKELKLVVLTDNADYKKLVKRLTSKGDADK